MTPGTGPAMPSNEAGASEFRPVGPATCLPGPGRLATVLLDGAEVVIANVRGRFYAIEGPCAHAGSPLGAGFLAGHLLRCAQHAWTYDVTDGWLVDPPVGRRIRSYRVRVADGVVELAPRP